MNYPAVLLAPVLSLSLSSLSLSTRAGDGGAACGCRGCPAAAADRVGALHLCPLPAPGAACAPPELCLHVHGGPAHEVSVVMLSVACPFEAFNRGAAAGHAWLLDCVLLLS